MTFRDLADWQEYVTERIAIGMYERGMSEEEAIAGAHALAGPKPWSREQLSLDGKPVEHPQTRSRRR